MTDAISYPLSESERSVVDYARRLANVPVENQHETYIAGLLAPWFKYASPTLRERLLNSFKLGQMAQREVARVLAQIKPIESFAEPLLKEALKARGWTDADPKRYGIKQVRLLSNLLLFFARQQFRLVDSLIQLALPEKFTPESLELNLVSSVSHHSLLQAALQNYEAFEAVEGGFDQGSCIYALRGTQQIEQAELKPEGFAQICRDLNLGMQYQWHLTRVFEPADDNWPADNANSKAYKLQAVFVQNLRQEFACALHVAYMKAEVTTQSYNYILNFLIPPGALFSYIHSGHSTLQIMGFEVPGVIVFWPQRKPAEEAQPCILYLPNSSGTAFHEFESFDLLKATLREWLKNSVFATYFFHLVPLRYRAEFMRRTDLKNITWDSLLLRRPPIINEPALMSETRHLPKFDDPFLIAWGLQLAKIKDDARLLIVPTEDEDSKSRLARQASFLNLGVSLLMVALGFVPVLGEILLVTSVMQLGVEVYDGIKAWQRGDRAAALEYLFDVAENFALAASSTAAAKALRPSPVVDALVAVTSVKGQKRLWRPDLRPYQYPNLALGDAEPDARGLYSMGNKQFIKLEDKVYQVKIDTATQRCHIQHPTEPYTYTPRVRHNGSGAWVHELDDPMQMSRMQLFRRLGPAAQGLSDAMVERVLAASNTSDDALRRLHMDNLPPPPALADSMRRVQLSQMIERFIVQMQQGGKVSTDTAQLQLELLTRLEGWPADRVLRVVNMRGSMVMEYGPEVESLHPRLQVTEAQIKNAELLKTTLESFSSAQIEVLLGQSVDGLEQQEQALARQLGRFAQATKSDLFSHLYKRGEVVTARMELLQKQFPSLPASVMGELMDQLAPAEMATVQSTGRLPLHILEEARSYTQVLRLNRALEGLYFEALSNVDSNTLAWQTLTHLPDWPTSQRLVLRDRATGQVLSSVGNPLSRYSQEIFKSAGEYHFLGLATDDIYSSPYLCRCVAKALPSSARMSLGLPDTDPGVFLSWKIASHAAGHRAQSANALGMQQVKPWFKSPMRLADGRAGYRLSGRSGHAAQASRPLVIKDLVMDLFPLMSEETVSQFLYHLELSPALTTRVLARFKAELQTLRSDLERWVDSPVWSQRRNGPRVLVTTQDKRAISQALLHVWRRQTATVSVGEHTGYVLNLNSWPVDCLPEISADFSHVSALHLSNSPNGKFPGSFLEKFPNLRILSLKSNQLSELPVEIAGMSELVNLNLQDNHIVLSGRTASALAGLTRLKSLNLTGNPLGRRISVTRMVDLERLYLRYSGLLTWPEGVESLSHLQTLDMRDNNISRIPLEVLSPGRTAINSVTHLHDNPLSADSLRRLENYRREYGISFGIAPRRRHVDQVRGIFHWASRPTFSETRVWNSLRDIAGSSDFFRVLEDLSASSQYLHGRESLSQRVWQVLNAMHDFSELRNQLFEVSANPNTCADGIPMIFSDLELRYRIFIAQSSVNAEAELLQLAQGLLRIELLDKHVQGVVEARIAAVHAEQSEYVRQLQGLIDEVSPDFASEPLANMTAEEQQGVAYRLGSAQALRLAQRLSPADLQARIAKVDPLEIQMFYQVKLAADLGLPARPKSMIFERVANVTLEQLEAAKLYVLTEDTAQARIAYIEKQGFWERFLEKKYPEHFQSVDSPLHERMQGLYLARERLSSQEYVSKTQAVGESRLLARQELISQLTREEVEKHPFEQEQS